MLSIILLYDITNLQYVEFLYDNYPFIWMIIIKNVYTGTHYYK